MYTPMLAQFKKIKRIKLQVIQVMTHILILVK